MLNLASKFINKFIYSLYKWPTDSQAVNCLMKCRDMNSIRWIDFLRYAMQINWTILSLQLIAETRLSWMANENYHNKLVLRRLFEGFINV